MTEYTLYIKRTRGTIYGVVTLQRVENGVMTKLFDKLPMASGQYGYLMGNEQDWVKSKGPTPIGEYWLSTKRELLLMEPFGTPFYCLSDAKGGRTISNGKVVRENIGVHLENRIPGTIGCTALLHDTPERDRQTKLFFKELDRLNAAGIEYIKTKVFF